MRARANSSGSRRFAAASARRVGGRQRLARQAGLGLPAAIFVITLLTLLAVSIYQLVSQNARNYEEQINLTRAFYAAESGAGFAMNSLFAPEDYPAYEAQPLSCVDWAAGEGFPRVYSFTVPGLNQCTATVSCDDVVAGAAVFPTFTSTGECGGVARIVQIRTTYD